MHTLYFLKSQFFYILSYGVWFLFDHVLFCHLKIKSFINDNYLVNYSNLFFSLSRAISFIIIEQIIFEYVCMAQASNHLLKFLIVLLKSKYPPRPTNSGFFSVRIGIGRRQNFTTSFVKYNQLEHMI